MRGILMLTTAGLMLAVAGLAPASPTDTGAGSPRVARPSEIGSADGLEPTFSTNDPSQPTTETWDMTGAPRVARPAEQGSAEGLEWTTPDPNAPQGGAPPYAPYSGGVCPDPCADREFCGIPEYLGTMYAPGAMYLIPWTGQHLRPGKWWTVFAAQSFTYDTNIYLEPEGEEEDDWISHTSVGVSLRRQGTRWTALATVGLTYDWYLEHEDESFLGGYGIFDLGYLGGGGFYAGLTDTVRYTDDPTLVENVTLGTLDTDRRDYWTNLLELRAGLDRGPWRAELAYGNELFWSDDQVLEDSIYMAHRLRGRVDFYLGPKLSLGALGGVRWLDYDEDIYDAWIYEAGITSTWRPVERLGFGATVGWTFLDPEDFDTEDSYFADLYMTWDATPCLNLAAGWSHTYVPTVGYGSELLDSVYLRAHYNIFDRWIFTARLAAQYGQPYEGSYVVDGGEMTLSADDYWLYMADLTAHLNLGCNWGVDLSYQFRMRDEDDDNLDYVDHRVTLGVSFAF